MEKITLSIGELAERTGISRTYLFGDIKIGKLPSLKVGKLRLIRVETSRRTWPNTTARRPHE